MKHTILFVISFLLIALGIAFMMAGSYNLLDCGYAYNCSFSAAFFTGISLIMIGVLATVFTGIFSLTRRITSQPSTLFQKLLEERRCSYCGNLDVNLQTGKCLNCGAQK